MIIVILTAIHKITIIYIDWWASLMSVGVSLMGTLSSLDLKAPCTSVLLNPLQNSMSQRTTVTEASQALHLLQFIIIHRSRLDGTRITCSLHFDASIKRRPPLSGTGFPGSGKGRTTSLKCHRSSLTSLAVTGRGSPAFLDGKPGTNLHTVKQM